MPDDESSSDEIEIGGKKKEYVIRKEDVAKIRKSLKKHGHKLGSKSPVVDRYIGRKIKPSYKNPVRSKYKPGAPQQPGTPKNTGNVKDFIDMARKGQSFKMGNRLKRKLQGKRK
jgi:hypothetical protein